MLERTFYLAVSGETGSIIVEAGVDDVRVHAVDQVDLHLGQPCAVDRKSIDPGVPESNGVQSTLD